jgi:DNA-binding XRE family transcriptional regulator
MTVDLVDRHAITNLRKMCKLERARLARMTDLSVQQITQLEEGGVSAFSSVEFKIQAALKVASIFEWRTRQRITCGQCVFQQQSQSLANGYGHFLPSTARETCQTEIPRLS